MLIPRIAYLSAVALVAIIVSLVFGLAYIRTTDKAVSRADYIDSLQTNR